MPTGTIAPFPFHQLLDNNGKNAGGYKLFTYEAGTSTKLSAYKEAALTNAHTNPIVLDSSGRPVSPIFLQPKSYKFVFALPSDTDPPASPIWTADNVAATPPFNTDLDVSGTSAEAIAVNDCVFLSDGTGSLTAGRWYKTDADFDYKSTLPRVIGFAMTETTAASQTLTIRIGGAVVTDTAIYTAGTVYYVSATAGGITGTAPSNPRRVAQAYSTIAFIVNADIEEPIKGYIPLDLTVGRILSGGATQNAAANGGLTASDTTPILQRVNAATDQALRLNYAATVVSELTWCFSYPPDWDPENVVEVHLLAASGGSSNSPTIAVAYFEGTGDANAGGNTAAVTGTTIAEYSVTITAANIGAHPNFAAVSLTPAAHNTDALFLYALWIEYTRKLKST